VPLVDRLAVSDFKVVALDKMLRVCGAAAVAQALSAYSTFSTLPKPQLSRCA
jgi:hypothetical protein